MTLYEFRAPDGTILEESFPFGEAPHLGETATIGGQECVRIVSDHVMNAQRTVQPFASRTIHPDDARDLGHTRFNEDGDPVFISRREAEDFSERSEGDYVFDGLAARAEANERVSLKEHARRQGISQ